MRLILATGMLAIAPALYAGSVSSADITIDQLDNSGTIGGATTDVGEFQVNNALGMGFINVLDSTGTQWLVQNLPVGLDAAESGDFTRFLINSNGSSMTTDNLIVNFSATPLQNIAAVNSADSSVESLSVAQMTLALGTTGNTAQENGVEAPAGNVSFSSTIANIDYQTGHQNVEAGINQCAPAAVANSLTYLGLNGNYTNTPGTFGPTGGTGSLVAALDTYTGRATTGCPPNGTNPCGVWPLDGKLQYINTLGNPNIVVNVQGTGAGLTAGNTTTIAPVQGQTYTDSQGQAIGATFQGAPTFAYIQSELAAGEDVEIDIAFPCPDGMGGTTTCRHYVEVTGAGTIGGVQFITHVSDQLQGQAGGNTSVQVELGDRDQWGAAVGQWRGDRPGDYRIGYARAGNDAADWWSAAGCCRSEKEARRLRVHATWVARTVLPSAWLIASSPARLKSRLRGYFSAGNLRVRAATSVGSGSVPADRAALTSLQAAV